MAEGNDPRVYFAAERTLLAWTRTSLALMGMGFVVARFALFLRLVARREATEPGPGPSNTLGVALVVLGALGSLVAAYQHWRFCRGLTAVERPLNYWVGFAPMFALGVTVTPMSTGFTYTCGVSPTSVR
jgi:putative membrane protein